MEKHENKKKRIPLKGILKRAVLPMLVFWQANLAAQDMQDVMPPSPMTSAFAQYLNTPVGTYTGTPNISVPIYTIKDKEITVPITLNYNASGIKVQQEASWIGLGWSLSAGGAIIQTVKEKNDLDMNAMVHDKYPFTPFPPCDVNSWENRQTFNDYDLLPDVFSYSYPGGSGEFVFGKNTDISSGETDNIHILDDKPIKIIYSQYYDASIYQTVQEFKIIDENGFTYVYGTKEKMRVESASSNNANITDADLHYPNAKIKAWYLDKIISPSGNEACFTYNVISVSSSTKRTLSLDSWAVKFDDLLTYQHIWLNGVGGSGGPSTFLCGCDRYQMPYIEGKTYTRSRTITYPVYLERIDFSDGFVEFVPDAAFREDIKEDQYKLQSIKVYSNTDLSHPVKVFSMEQSYFNESYSSDPEKYEYKRLKLDKVVEHGTQDKVFEFFYNQSMNLPPKTSNSFDHWGYFNGKPNGGIPDNLLPAWTIKNVPPPFALEAFDLQDLESKMNARCEEYTQGWDNTCMDTCQGETCLDCWENDVDGPLEYQGADRSSDAQCMKAGILEKMVYPTGGYSRFVYEPHVFEIQNELAAGSENYYRYEGLTQGAGLRIKQIYVHDDATGGEKISKTYGYEGGKLMTPPFYHDLFYHYGLVDGTFFLGLYASLESNNYFALKTTRGGSYVGYDKVTGYDGDSLANIGKTEYFYRNQADQMPPFHTDNVETLSHIDNGLLEKKNTYKKEDGDTYRTVTVETWDYGEEPIIGQAIRSKYFLPDQVTSFYCSFDTLYPQWWPLLSQTSKTYEYGVGNATSTVKYQYNPTHMQPVRIAKSTSNGDSIVTENQNAVDIMQTCDVYPDYVINLANKNMVSQPIFTKTSRIKADGTKELTNASYTEYWINPAPKPKSVYLYQGGQGIADISPQDFLPKREYLEFESQISMPFDAFTHVDQGIAVSDVFVFNDDAGDVAISGYIDYDEMDDFYDEIQDYYDETNNPDDPTFFKPIVAVIRSNAMADSTIYINGHNRGRKNFDFQFENPAKGTCFQVEIKKLGHGTGGNNYAYNGSEGTATLSYDGYNITGYMLPASLEKQNTLKYNAGGNLIYAEKEGAEIATSYFWYYANTLPIVKAVGTGDLQTAVQEVFGLVSFEVDDLFYGHGDFASLQHKNRLAELASALQNHQEMQNSQVWVYTYKPFVGISSETDPNGVATYFLYDGSGRLEYIKNQDYETIKHNKYHFKENQ